jgi:hypothetical protein
MVKTKSFLISILFFFISILAFGQNAVETIKIQKDSAESFQTIPEKELNERLHVVETMLEHNEKAANIWWYSWIGLYGGATIGQGLVAYVTPDKKLRQDMIVSAGTTLVGFAGQIIFPVKSGYEMSSTDIINGLSYEEKLNKLLDDEKKLKYQSDRAISGKNWQTHAMNFAVNLTGGLITWLGFKRPLMDGVSSFAIGMAVSEIQIFSQPTRAKKDYRSYCSKYGLNGYTQSSRPEYVIYANVIPGGLSVGIGF